MVSAAFSMLPREAFLKSYAEHARRLGYPPDAASYYGPLRQQLDDALRDFDTHYDKNRKTFWVHKNGKLGFSKVRGEGLPKGPALSTPSEGRRPAEMGRKASVFCPSSGPCTPTDATAAPRKPPERSG